MRQDRIRARIHHYADGLELPISVTPHTFRRSCTSEMIKGNANLYHVKQLLGHKSFETLNHYAKLDITDLQRRTNAAIREKKTRCRKTCLSLRTWR